MKKIFFSLAILAAFASCSKNDVDSDAMASQPKQIGFSTLNDRVSKAANADNDDFRVFAAEGSAWLFQSYVTTYAEEAKEAVGGPYWWPVEDSAMAFYAYAPYSESGCNVIEGAVTTATIPLTYTVPADAQEDFTVAEPKKYAGKDYYPTDDVVPFVFKHMLAKVTVKVELDTEFGGKNYISVNEETEPDPATSYNNKDAAFTSTFTAATNTIAVDAIDAIAATTSTKKVDTDAAYAYTGETVYYIAPQPFLGSSLQINGITVRNTNTNSAMINGDMDKIIFDGTELNAAGVTTTDSAFEAGKNYELTVTITGDDLKVIKFTAAEAAWTSVTGGLIQ